MILVQERAIQLATWNDVPAVKYDADGDVYYLTDVRRRKWGPLSIYLRHDKCYELERALCEAEIQRWNVPESSKVAA